MIPTKTIQLDFWHHPTDILHLVQGEADGRKVEFKIFDNGSAFDLTGYTVQMAVKKPDGNIVVNAGSITDAANGVCEVTITSQVVAVAGNLHAELQILKEGQLSKSLRIVTKVASGVDADGIEPSVSEFNALQTLIGQAADALEALDTALDTALGAKPSTLTTTAKTIVPAINELQANSSLSMPAKAPGEVYEGDFNDFPAGFRLAKGANSPTGSGYWQLICFYYYNGVSKIQMAFGYGNNKFYIRTFYNYAGFGWTPWREL